MKKIKNKIKEIKMARLAGTKDANLLILDKMDDRTLLSYCQTNRYAENLCNNEDFWRNRFVKVYGIGDAKLKDKNRTWKNYYLSVLYYTNKYTTKKALEKVAEKNHLDLFNLFSKGMKEYDINRAIINSGNKDLIYKLNKIDSHLLDVGLLISARKGNRELVDFYLKKGANPIFTTIGALQGNQLDLFQEFNKKQEISANNGLEYSAQAGNKELMNLFIRKGADEYNAALRSAALTGQRHVLDFLIQKGANDWQGALNYAVEGGRKELFDFFLLKGAKITEFTEISAEISGDKDIIAYVEKLKNEGY